MYQRVKDRQKRYRATRTEHYREIHRQWRARTPWTPEQIAASRERLARWNSAHPDSKAIRENRRRARKVGSINDFTEEQWIALKAAYRNRCVYCGKRPKKLTIEHVIPLAKGGPHTISNIVPACWPCNKAKRTGSAPDHQAVLFA